MIPSRHIFDLVMKNMHANYKWQSFKADAHKDKWCQLVSQSVGQKWVIWAKNELSWHWQKKNAFTFYRCPHFISEDSSEVKVGYSPKKKAVVQSHHEGWRVYIIVTVSPFLPVCVYAWLLIALKVKLGLQFHWQLKAHTSKQIHYIKHITIIYFYIQFQYPQLFFYQLSPFHLEPFMSTVELRRFCHDYW